MKRDPHYTPQPPCDEAGFYKDPNNRRFQVMPSYAWLEAAPPGIPAALMQGIQDKPSPTICFVQLQPQFDVGPVPGHRPTQLVAREVFNALVRKRIYVAEDKTPTRSISARRRKALANGLLAEAIQHEQAQAAGQPAVSAPPLPALAPAAAPVSVNTGHKRGKSQTLTAGQ